MDETEVQVEIACWAQDHPEAKRVNWKDGNEPWVSFEGKLCTLHVGLGGLIWNIEVPVGYQTELSLNGSRQRCWDPLDFHDTMIVPDKNSPFHVSVVYPKTENCNVLLDETRLLVQQPGYDIRDAQGGVTNFLKKLRISENSDISAQKEQRMLIKSSACFQAMNKAETLSEVLDAIHALTTFHRENVDYTASFSSGEEDLDEVQKLNSMNSNSSGETFEDDLFGPELALKWSWIKTQVEYAAEACRIAASKGRNTFGGDATSPNSCSGVLFVRMVNEMDGLEIDPDNIITHTSGSSLLLDFEDSESGDYAYVRGLSSIQPRIYNSQSVSRSDSDSQLSVHSDESWEEVAGMSEEVPTDILLQSLNVNDSEETGIGSQLPSKNKRKFKQIYTPPAAAAVAAAGADILPASTSPTTSKRPAGDAAVQDSLQHCDVSFNAASFSVECSIRLEQFMHNNTAALTAMGLSLDHPLRLEIVPNKEQVDALAWTGSVEVYASQQSEWHNHVSEEVCGLLCYIPHIVRHYVETNVLDYLNHRPTREPKGEFFRGLLETVVKRLANVNRDRCFICSGPLLEVSRTFSSRVMWPCEENMCQALYASWQTVSTYDIDERAWQEEGLAEVEKDLREDFPYSTAILDNLQCALDVYNVNSEGLHYGQMIRALARIELWNRRDVDKYS